MRVLHLCSYYTSSTVHAQLFEHLARRGIEQLVYAPLKRSNRAKPKGLNPSIKYHFPLVYRPWHRLWYGRKVRVGLASLLDGPSLGAVDLVHAHTLFSDGGIALELLRRRGLPYVVAVRGTDLNWYYRYFLHCRSYAYEVVRRASAVVFLSPAYRSRLLARLPSALAEEVKAKASVIPNGVDSYWFGERPPLPKPVSERIRVLFVGKLCMRKNIPTIIRACDQLQRTGSEVTLRLVGGPGNRDWVSGERDQSDIIRKLVAGNPDVRLVGRINDRRVLRDQYRWADVFVMPSHTETFGIAYAEALSQGTPIICTRGEGFDGWFEPGICGHAVSATNAAGIAEKIVELKRTADPVRCVEAAKRFDWSRVAAEYERLYASAMTGLESPQCC